MKNSPSNTTALVTGAAGFIGSQLVDRLLGQGQHIIGIDNFSRGTLVNLETAAKHRNFQFFKANLNDTPAIREIIGGRGVNMIWHLAANSDIVAGMSDPAIDLQDTFLTTFHLLGVAREFGIRRFAFASTSAVYGVHDKALTEETGPLTPISNYGAMKLASEAVVSAASESFLEQAWVFRFPNVVGPRATHGIIFDLLTKLSQNPPDLEVLGDGSQQKPYLHVSELIDAMLLICEKSNAPFNLFNIGPPDQGASVREIAEAVRHEAAPSLPIRFTGGSKGWVGDVPRFYYSIEKLRSLGWSPALTSTQAMERAVTEICKEFGALQARQ